MGQVLVRNLDDDVISRLKQRAEVAGLSLEQFLRDVLTMSAPLTPDEKVAISRRLRAAFAADDWDTPGAIRWGRDDEFFEIEKKFDVA
jgi:plasmid stability protein